MKGPAEQLRKPRIKFLATTCKPFSESLYSKRGILRDILLIYLKRRIFISHVLQRWSQNARPTA